MTSAKNSFAFDRWINQPDSRIHNEGNTNNYPFHCIKSERWEQCLQSNWIPILRAVYPTLHDWYLRFRSKCLCPNYYCSNYFCSNFFRSKFIWSNFFVPTTGKTYAVRFKQQDLIFQMAVVVLSPKSTKYLLSTSTITKCNPNTCSYEEHTRIDLTKNMGFSHIIISI